MREYDGTGIAAPQVFTPLRIFLYEVAPRDAQAQGAEVPLTALFNATYEPVGDGDGGGFRGCLSVPFLWGGVVPRFETIRVRALDRSGKPVDFEASGYHARVLQHEIDHLDGLVYLDRMPDMKIARLHRQLRLRPLERLAELVERPGLCQNTASRGPMALFGRRTEPLPGLRPEDRRRAAARTSSPRGWRRWSPGPGRTRSGRFPFATACCGIEFMSVVVLPLRPLALRRRGRALLAAAGGPPDRRRHRRRQDGAGAAEDLRPDARAQVGHLDGRLRVLRRLLPRVPRHAGHRRDHPGGRLRARAARRRPKS